MSAEMNLCLSPTSAALATSEIVLELVFDGLRRNQLAAGGFEQLLLAVGDVEKAVGVDVGDVAGAEPALRVEALRIGFGFVPVAGEDRRAADQQLAVFGEFEFDIGQRHAGRAHAVMNGRVEGDDGRGFREAVALPQRDAGRREPAARCRCRAARRRR